MKQALPDLQDGPVQANANCLMASVVIVHNNREITAIQVTVADKLPQMQIQGIAISLGFLFKVSCQHPLICPSEVGLEQTCSPYIFFFTVFS